MLLLKIPRGNFNAVAYTADGRHLVSLNSGTSVRIWSTADFVPRLKLALPGHLYTHHSIGLTENLLVLSRGVYGMEAAWDALRGEVPPGDAVKLRPIEMENATPYTTYVYSPDERHILGLSQGYYGRQGPKLSAWDALGRHVSAITSPESYFAPAVGPGGNVVALFRGSEATIFDRRTQEEVCRLEHSDNVTMGAFSPDGTVLVTAAGRSVWRWDVAGRKGERYEAFRKHIDAVAYHPHGHVFAAADGDGEIRTWDAASGRQSASLNFDVGAIHDLAFSPDGMTVAGAGHKNAVVVWDLE